MLKIGDLSMWAQYQIKQRSPYVGYVSYDTDNVLLYIYKYFTYFLAFDSD